MFPEVYETSLFKSWKGRTYQKQVRVTRNGMKRYDERPRHLESNRARTHNDLNSHGFFLFPLQLSAPLFLCAMQFIAGGGHVVDDKVSVTVRLLLVEDYAISAGRASNTSAASQVVITEVTSLKCNRHPASALFGRGLAKSSDLLNMHMLALFGQWMVGGWDNITLCGAFRWRPRLPDFKIVVTRPRWCI